MPVFVNLQIRSKEPGTLRAMPRRQPRVASNGCSCAFAARVDDGAIGDCECLQHEHCAQSSSFRSRECERFVSSSCESESLGTSDSAVSMLQFSHGGSVPRTKSGCLSACSSERYTSRSRSTHAFRGRGEGGRVCCDGPAARANCSRAGRIHSTRGDELALVSCQPLLSSSSQRVRNQASAAFASNGFG